LPTTPQILEQMHALAETAATGPEAITMMMGSTGPFVAERSSLTGDNNQIEIADGVENIVFNAGSDAVFTFEFDASSNALELQNLASGASQNIDIGAAEISSGGFQEVEFGVLGVTIILNDDFDKSLDIESAGGSVSASAGSTGVIDHETFNITEATLGVMDSITSASGDVDGTAAASATISIAGFSGNGDLSSTGQKFITLTDGTDSFALEFTVTTALANGDDFDFSVNGLGTLFALDVPNPNVVSARDSGETLTGSANTNKFASGAGNDTLLGRGGDDIIFGLAGQDVYDGRADTDTLDFTNATSGVVARLDHGAARTATGDRATLSNFENVTGSHFDDLIVGNAAANRIIGRSGDDQLTGLGGDDQLFGNTGDDVLRGGAGNDILNGSEGQDSLRGDVGDDVLRGGNGNDTALGGDGQDHIEGGAGNDRAYGQDGDDTLIGGDGADRLRGGAGDDTISGGDGSDHIIGGADADVIDGGAGFDRIFGGTGADVFVMTDGFGYNRIFDFEDGVDTMNFADHASVSSIADLTIRTFNLGADTRIDVAASEFIVLVGVDVSNVTASDFVF
jgi:Ca2+-binding RTX toxin-like protein